MATFDYQRALDVGYSPQEIADYLAKNPQPGDIDIKAATEAGYSPEEIVKHEAAKQPKNLLGVLVGPTLGNAAHDAIKWATPGSVQRGSAQFVDGLANTADMVGATGVGGYLHRQVDRNLLDGEIDPDHHKSSFEAVSDNFNKGNYGAALSNVPGAVGEAVPQLAGALAGGLPGAVISGIATQAGNIAKARAAADGRSEVTGQDIAVAVGSSAVLGALNRVGLGPEAGTAVADAVKSTLGMGAPGAVSKLAGASLVHGASDAAQSVGQQLATTAGTEQGANIDPGAVAAQAAAGMGSRVALAGARGAVDLSTGELAARNRAAQQDAMRQQWSQLQPEDQQALINRAAAAKAVTDKKGTFTENPVEPPNNVAARGASTDYFRSLQDTVDHLSNPDVGILEPAQADKLSGFIADAKNTQRPLDIQAVRDTLKQTSLPEPIQTTMADAISQLDMMSSAGIKERNTSNLGKLLGTLGAFAGTHTPHPFLGAALGGELGAGWGNKLARKLGWSDPVLLKEGAKAAAMLEAAGVPIPDTQAGMLDAINQTQNAYQAQAMALGLDPAKYGTPGLAKQAADQKWQLDYADAQHDNKAFDAQQVAQMRLMYGDALAEDRQRTQQANFQRGQDIADATAMDRQRTQQSNFQRGQDIADALAIDRQRTRGTELLEREGGKVAMMARDLQARSEAQGEAARQASVQQAQGSPQTAPGAPPAIQVAQARAQASTGSQGAPEATPILQPSRQPPQGYQSTQGSRLPDWQYGIGHDLQTALQLSGTPKNVNMAQEAHAALAQALANGSLDKEMHAAIKSHKGRLVEGIYNLIRNEALLRHGIDRRTMEAQQADPALQQAAE